ncbi:MAG: hypothetical protein RLZZ210_626 [Pseudomonadota bacterium]|jgi:type IV secretion system protein VirD4
MTKKLLILTLLLIIISKILASGLGYILFSNIDNYSILLIVNTWQNIDNLNMFTQIFIYLSFLIYGLSIYRLSQFILSKNTTKNLINDLHGSARFSDFEELQETNLLSDNGIFIGGVEHKNKNYYLRSNGNEHCLILAPTRAGKGVCLVIPTLLSWEHSCIVYDIKRELYHLTSKWRGSDKGGKNNIYRFDPAQKDSDCFNPMQEIRINTEYQIADAQNIAYMLVDTVGEGILGKHWLQTAYTLFTACILYIAHKNYDINQTHGSIPQMLDLLCDKSGIKNTVKELAEFSCVDEEAQKTINLIGYQMQGKEEKELSGIISTTVTQLSLYFDPLVNRAVSKSDFTIDDICNKEKPATLYLVTDPSNKDRYQPLIRLIINLILRKLTAQMNFVNGKGQSPNKHRLLLLLDEFPSLGNIPILEDSLAFMAGYGIKAMLIAQDLNQIYSKYTKNESIVANCHIISAFAPNNPDTANWLCRKLGDTTIIKENVSVSGKRKDIILSNTSTSQNEVKRNLMTPEEIMTMPSLQFDNQNKLIDTGNMLVFVNGKKPIFGKQMPFFIDEIFTTKL